MTNEDEGRRFAELWESCARRVYAYALRHTDADSAQDVVAETFLVAWRRLADVPGDPLPWLLVVARNTMSNRRRSTYRRRLLERELARFVQVARPAQAADVPVRAREEVLRALARLTDAEREALLLTAWDGLTPQQGAKVAGCSEQAFTKRLSRARARVAAAEHEDDTTGTAQVHELRRAR
ncbi:RNA polymerase sigma factor [Cellulomonas citrea]|uniref:RNA polymerase sigma factor n=1 Tax=Cellulomonas citrea TaxID=1909423 RepID=UPI00135B1D74|nr:sigma-70 family RNA polymerase sigma factor [Cellulomonas citrea]